MTNPSNRSDISIFHALDILRQVNEREAAGTTIMRMGAGQPCFGVPEPVIEYAKQILDQDPCQGYTEAMGMPLLRERIVQYYQTYYGVHINAANIAITAGSSCGFILALIAAFDKGDTIALITPTYPAYRNMLKALDLNIIEIEGAPKKNFQPTRGLLEEYEDKIDGIIINSPSNPTGAMIDEQDLKEICAWCDEKNITLLSDEAYHGITYEEKAVTAATYSPNAIILNTFSKYFAMTGWRMGWAIVPDNLRVRVKMLAESLFVSAPTISQHVAYKVFDHIDILDSYVASYKINRDYLLKHLPEAGFDKIIRPQGAFYLYANIAHLSNDSMAFCNQMLDHARVSTTPGIDFDRNRGTASIRICYADSKEKMIEACQRLKNWQS